MNNHVHSAPQSKQEENREERKNHVCSVIETRQSKATMPKDNSSFFPKKSCLRRDHVHVHVCA